MKTIGIGVENHKLERYKTELQKAGFENVWVSEFTAHLSFINVIITEDQVQRITDVCRLVETFFHRSN